MPKKKIEHVSPNEEKEVKEEVLVSKIDEITVDFGRSDLNEVVAKLNEVIRKVNG